jgi:hypothetical protein
MCYSKGSIVSYFVIAKIKPTYVIRQTSKLLYFLREVFFTKASAIAIVPESPKLFVDTSKHSKLALRFSALPIEIPPLFPISLHVSFKMFSEDDTNN